MDEPKVGARDGGMVSAPVFREIAQQILTGNEGRTDATDQTGNPDRKGSFRRHRRRKLPTRNLRPHSPDKEQGTEGSLKLPGKKPKATDPKKTNEKKFAEAGKLTAILERRLVRYRLVRDRRDKT